MVQRACLCLKLILLFVIIMTLPYFSRMKLTLLGRHKSSAAPSIPYISTTIQEFSDKNLQLYIRLSYNHSWGEVRSISLPSQLLFWPHVRTHLVFDKEDIEGPQGQAVQMDIETAMESFRPLRLNAVFLKSYLGHGLEGIPGGPECNCVWHGYQRSHLDMMFADQVVKSKYVGLLDTDAMFVTLVTPQSVFSPEGKPRVIGVLGRADRGSDAMWRNIAASTAFFLKRDYVMSCMSFFPVVIATAHIREMRAHVEKVHSKSFVKVYKEMFRKWGFYCHFSIMCNYAWHFHQESYSWHYHNYQQNRPMWDMPIPGQILSFAFLQHKDIVPKARVTTHASYTAVGKHLYWEYRPEIARQWLAQGFCFTVIAQAKTVQERHRWSETCRAVEVSSLDTFQPLLFRFEAWLTWEWDPRTRQAQAQHYDTVKTAPNWTLYGQQILQRTQQAIWRRLSARQHTQILHT